MPHANHEPHSPHPERRRTRSASRPSPRSDDRIAGLETDQDGVEILEMDDASDVLETDDMADTSVDESTIKDAEVSGDAPRTEGDIHEAQFDELIENERSVTDAAPVLSPPDQPGAPGPMQLQILNVQVSEIELSESWAVQPKRLKSTVWFRLSGADAVAIAQDSALFEVAIYVVDLESRNILTGASSQDRFQFDRFEYVSDHEIPVPGPGRYELHSTVFILPPYTWMASWQGPILNIVPWRLV